MLLGFTIGFENEYKMYFISIILIKICMIYENKKEFYRFNFIYKRV